MVCMLKEVQTNLVEKILILRVFVKIVMYFHKVSSKFHPFHALLHFRVVILFLHPSPYIC